MMRSKRLNMLRRITATTVCVVLSLLMHSKGFSQLDISGPTSVFTGTSYTYYPTFNGSSSYPYTGPYYYAITGGVVTGTSNTSKSGNNNGVLYSMGISVTWSGTTGTLSLSCNLGTKFLTVTKINPLAAGTLSPASQTIHYNTTPTTITGTVATGGHMAPTYAYQWMSSPNGTSWTNINGATGQNYSPGPLTAPTHYRRMVTETHTLAVAYTSPVTVTVYPQLICTISPTAQTVNSGTASPTLVGTATGGSGSYNYQWQSSTDNVNWTNRVTTKDYSPGILGATTNFRLIATSAGLPATSNTSTITINFIPGALLKITSSTPSGGGIVNLMNVLPSGGNGTYSYEWYKSTNEGASWQIVSGETGTSYTTPVMTITTWYYVNVTSGGYVGNSNIVTFGIPNPPNVSTTSTVLCNGATATLSATGSSGTITWYNQNNTQVGTGYQFVTGTAGTYYATSASTYGVSDPSNSVTIAVPGAPTAGPILGSAICVLNSTAQLANAVLGGSWSSSNSNIVKVFNDGIITGKASGSATITYTVTNGCGTTSQQLGVTVVPFSSYSTGLGRGVEDPIIIDTITLAANAAKITQFRQDTLYSAAHTIKNVIALKVIEETEKYIPGDFAATVVVKIEYGHSPAEIFKIDSTHLRVNYTKGANTQYDALKYISLNDAEYIKVTVVRVEAPVTVNSVNFDTKDVLLLTSSMMATRFYKLADNKVPVLSFTSHPAGDVPDALAVNWIHADHANNNFTQLEWTWLEEQMIGSYMNGSSFDTALLFKTSATRIDLPGASAIGNYNIPLLYNGTGKLYIRVRAVNIMPSGSRSDGPWSGVSSFTFTGHNNNLNWQATTSFAEEGKRKTAIQYFDGSLRSRQTVTKDNTTETTVIAETFYDGQGRPAIQVLPAPGIKNIIAYTNNLNKFNGQPDNTNPLDYFDFTTTTYGRYATAPLSNGSGTAQYYSNQNPELNDAPFNKNIAAANGFPYTVTRYTPDATGRIMMQGGVGDSLHVGGRHATKYYYGSAGQEELDALFGTEVGNYTHYVKNMVQDANGQMSVSYVDMHGRTIATALAGESPESMQALDLSSSGHYKNQEGATTTRNLLDKGTNIFKGNQIESINTLLVPARTAYNFNYQVPARSVQLPTCSGGTISYPCKFDLQISISDEYGDTAAIVYNYPGIERLTFQQSVILPPGSYSIRKTLTINEDSLAAFLAAYNSPGVGLCRTQQFLVDSIAAQDSMATQCNLPVTPLTCTTCLDSLGSYQVYLLKYANSIGLTSTELLTNSQVADIRQQYISDSNFCASLNMNTSRFLDNIRKQMIADMIPYSGQYARESGSGTMFSKFNIFSTSGNPTYTQPFYKYPKNRLMAADNYYDAFGNTASSLTPLALALMTKQQFEQTFEYSWASSLLPYHPEFAKLKYAEDNLKSSYDFIDSVNQTVNNAFNPINSDPFFSAVSPTVDKTAITQYANVSWQGGYSMWQMAYAEAFGCKTKVDTTQRRTCYNNMPKQFTATGTSINPGTGAVTLTATLQAQAWSMFRAFYTQARRGMVNKFINDHSDGSNNTTLISQGYQLHFPADNVQEAQNLGWSSWYPAANGTFPAVNLQDSVAKYNSSCDSYINNWRIALLQCPSLPSNPITKEQIIASITTRMKLVCQNGMDGANPYGSSTVAPAFAGSTFTSFEQVVNHVFDSLGIARDLYCHPYGIEFPKPYGKNPIVTRQLIANVDTCNCSQFNKIKTEVANAGYSNTNLTTINQYLLSKYQDSISPVLYQGLQQCGQVYLANCITTTTNQTCYDHGQPYPCTVTETHCDTLFAIPLASVQPFPAFLNCGFNGADDNCFTCAEFKQLDSSFYAIFGKRPVFNTAITNDTALAYNALFAKYVNFKTGLQHDWPFYADRFRSTECGVGGLTGTSGALSICLDRTPLNDTSGIIKALSPCQEVRNRATVKAELIYEVLQDQLKASFRQSYIDESLKTNELFKVTYTLKEYHYTLYYYDQAGNLVKTVPPKGVNPIYRQTFFDSVAVARNNGTLLTPQHELATRYCYNSLNQVNIQKTPDGGSSRFWYDRLGRLALSQNANQRSVGNVYSYTWYDTLSRITQVGQITGSTPLTDATAKNEISLATWFNTASPSRNQITQTVYDVEYGAINGVVLSQRNLRNRVSYSQVVNTASDSYAASSTFYTYDIHGNVDTLLQDFGNSTGIANMMNESGNRFKKIVYDYDLISGKVNMVSYQPGFFDNALQTWINPTDRYYQRYVYDADNRLTDVYSGKDSIMLYLFPEREAHYNYYKHGPLARTELGQLKVQGLDYVYTLQGWLKAINPVKGGTLANGTDTSEFYPTARDAYGFSLHYYNNDYKAIGHAQAPTNVLTALPSAGSPLYNGNIATMAVNLPNFGGPKVYSYKYDQLNRIVAMDAYDGLTPSPAAFAPIALDDYRERVTYDPNGNIITYQRNGNTARLAMDDMTYSYKTGTNQLHKVTDAAQDAAAGDYDFYKDIKQGQNDNNYQYDPIGNLVKDVSEGISNISWNVYGKIKTITKSSGTINYAYDAQGNRIIKHSGSDTTAYVRDASGNVLAVYTRRVDKGVVQNEKHLYGSSRLAVAGYQGAEDTTLVLAGGFGNALKSTFTRGQKLFELSNHLGNVLTTVSDKRLAIDNNTDGEVDDYTADIISATDYYPFGMIMPGRNGYRGQGGWVSQAGSAGPDRGYTASIDLNNPRTTTQPSEYVAAGSIQMNPGFESAASDDFVAYIDDSGGGVGGSSGSGDGSTGSSNGYYRYGFNGKENDNEVKGIGNQQDYGMRIYDPRLGKFLSVDPLTQSYPWYTPYQFAGNKPIWAIDLDGAEEYIKTFTFEDGKATLLKVIKNSDVQIKFTSTSEKNGQTPFVRIIIDKRTGKPMNPAEIGQVQHQYVNKDGNRLNIRRDYSGRYLSGANEIMPLGNNNMLGSIYIGPTNPTYIDATGEKKPDYRREPQDEVDAAAMQHDMDYDTYPAAGPGDAFFNKGVIPADKKLVDAANKVREKAKTGGMDNITGKPVHGSTANRASVVSKFFSWILKDPFLKGEK